MCASILLIILLCCVYNTVSLGQEVGDDCTLSFGRNGTCVIIHDCIYAKNLLVFKQKPEICGFEGPTPIVCCVNWTSLANPAPVKQYGEISEKKCKEFYPYPVSSVLVPGGKPSLLREFPHMALIGFGNEDKIEWQCGGSLISLQFILTAAHCLNSLELGAAKWVRLGDLDISTDTDMTEPQNFTIKRRIPHPDYKRPSRYHDIALIELDRPAIKSDFVAPACLDTTRHHDEKQMMATGWGRTSYIGEISSFLLKTDLDLMSNSLCKTYYQNVPSELLDKGIDDNLQICAGGGEKQDTCQGDSGGPLHVINCKRTSGIKVYNIAGITSFGKACGLSKAPGIYTRVYNYLSWIEDTVWPSG